MGYNILNNKIMKRIIIFSLLLFFGSCLFKNNIKQIDLETEKKIKIIINNRKIFLANIIYENEQELIKKKYNINDKSIFFDVSSLKIEEEFGMYSLFGENDTRQIIDPLGNQIVNKWKKLNYDPNYYFNYDKIVPNIHLSFLKMMDFYNSDDLKKYEDSLQITLDNRYNSGEKELMKYLKNEYNFKNRLIWKNQNDSILTLIPIHISK